MKKTYYRFYFGTEEIIEFDVERVSYKEAERRVKERANIFDTTYEYCGEFTHN